MQVWTQGGVALPSREDVPIPAGKDVLAAESAVCQAGLRLHARLRGRADGVQARVHQPDPDKDLRRGPVIDDDQGGHRHRLAGQ